MLEVGDSYWENKGEKKETPRELSWQRSKNGKATVNYHLHPQVWCIHNGEGDRTPATKTSASYHLQVFLERRVPGDWPSFLLQIQYIRKMWKCEGNTKRPAALPVKDTAWHAVSAGFAGDHLEVAGCTIIVFWVVTFYIQDVSVFL